MPFRRALQLLQREDCGFVVAFRPPDLYAVYICGTPGQHSSIEGALPVHAHDNHHTKSSERLMQRVGTIDKCFDILETILGSDREGLGIREIARQLDINTTTVHNICQTLCVRGYLRQNPNSKRYQLGTGLLPLAQSNQVWRNLEEAAEPLVRRCRQELDESIMLAVLDNTEVSTLIYLPSVQALRVHEPHAMGDRAYGTAVGKVLLSTLDNTALSRYFQLFPPRAFTDATITDPDRMRQELETVRTQGYALTCGELTPGVRAVAVPVLGPAGTPFAALGASAPQVRMDIAQVELTRATLLRYAEAIASKHDRQP